MTNNLGKQPRVRKMRLQTEFCQIPSQLVIIYRRLIGKPNIAIVRQAQIHLILLALHCKCNALHNLDRYDFLHQHSLLLSAALIRLVP